MAYSEDDDRFGVDPFTIAVAEKLAAKAGVELGSLRNFGESPTVGYNKDDFIKEANYFTDPFSAHPTLLNPCELAEIWKAVQEDVLPK